MQSIDKMGVPIYSKLVIRLVILQESDYIIYHDYACASMIYHVELTIMCHAHFKMKILALLSCIVKNMLVTCTQQTILRIALQCRKATHLNVWPYLYACSYSPVFGHFNTFS